MFAAEKPYPALGAKDPRLVSISLSSEHNHIKLTNMQPSTSSEAAEKGSIPLIPIAAPLSETYCNTR